MNKVTGKSEKNGRSESKLANWKITNWRGRQYIMRRENTPHKSAYVHIHEKEMSRRKREGGRGVNDLKNLPRRALCNRQTRGGIEEETRRGQ